MSPILLLTGLLALAYFGSMLVGGRTIRGFGLPSGTEFLLLGILFGPRFVGVFTRQNLVGFEALTNVAVAWLAFVIGSHFGIRSGKGVSAKRVLTGFGLALVGAVMTGGVAAAIAFMLTDLRPRELLIMAVAVGAVSTETTRHALRWVTQRYQAQGPLTTLVGDVFEVDDAIPILLLAVVAALAGPGAGIALPYMPWSSFGGTLALGVAVGATCAALFDIEPRSSQRWGILLGTGLLTVGVSLRFGLSAVAAMFVMGVAARRLAKEQLALEQMLGMTERAVMLPTLMLAGAHIAFPHTTPFVQIALGVIAARVAAKLLAARALRRALRAPMESPLTLALGLTPAGALSVSVALAFELQMPGPVSEWVLALAALHVVLGEIVGPLFLHRALRNAGDISEESARPAVRRTTSVSPARARAGARAIRATSGRSRFQSAPGAPLKSTPPGGSSE